MSERRLRGIVGALLVFGQLGLLLVVTLLTASDKFTQPELLSTFGMIGPLLAAYVTSAVRTFLKQKHSEIGAFIATERAFVAITYPAAFIATLFGLVLWKAFGSLSFDSFLKFGGALQTALGVYVALVVEDLFHQPSKRGTTNVSVRGEGSRTP